MIITRCRAMHLVHNKILHFFELLCYNTISKEKLVVVFVNSRKRCDGVSASFDKEEPFAVPFWTDVWFFFIFTSNILAGLRGAHSHYAALHAHYALSRYAFNP